MGSHRGAGDVYDRTSAVVLLDGLHAGYTMNADGSPTKLANIETTGSPRQSADTIEESWATRADVGTQGGARG